jgi:type IV pilus assembly protein PilA
VRRSGFSLVELMMVVAIISILSVIAVPNFIKFQGRSKQSEAKTVLKGYYAAERAYAAEVGSYTDVLTQLGFAPERGNRYAYQSQLAPSGWEGRAARAVTHAPGLQGIEVDCFKLGGGCVAQPVRPSGIAFTATYESGVTGPADTGFVGGSSGGYIVEARGTIDNDDANDVWLISSGSLVVTDTSCSVAGQSGAGSPVNVYNDVACP